MLGLGAWAADWSGCSPNVETGGPQARNKTWLWKTSFSFWWLSSCWPFFRDASITWTGLGLGILCGPCLAWWAASPASPASLGHLGLPSRSDLVAVGSCAGWSKAAFGLISRLLLVGCQTGKPIANQPNHWFCLFNMFSSNRNSHLVACSGNPAYKRALTRYSSLGNSDFMLKAHTVHI